MEDWDRVALIFSTKNGESCKFKYFSMFTPKTIQIQWREEEDKCLRTIIALNFFKNNNFYMIKIAINIQIRKT